MFKRIGLCVLGVAWSITASAEPKDDARRHFISGLEAAQAEQYEQALTHFLDAQRAYPHPNTLYNIARAYQDLNDLVNAIHYYELFQQAKPEKAADVAPILDVLRARLATTLPDVPEIDDTNTPVASTDLESIKTLLLELQEAVSTLERQVSTETTPLGTDIPNPPVVDIPPLSLPETEFRDDAYERIVVTASRYGQDPLDAPSTVTVLSKDTIERSGALNIPDLLRRVVGVDVMSMTASQPDFSIRGFNRELSNKVLVLIDGRSVYWDFIGTTLWSTLPIAMTDIERIEVIRGPGSAVYGANAMTGVVNIITKTPGVDPHTLISVSAGFPDILEGDVSTSGRVKDTAFRLGGHFSTHGRWAKSQLIGPNSGTKMNLENPNRSRQTASFNGRFDRKIGSKGFASLSGGFSQGYAEFYNIGALGNSLAENTHLFLRTDANYGPLLFRAFWNRDMGFTQPVTEPVGASRSVSSPFKADTIDVELSGNGEFSTGTIAHRLSGGFGYRRKSIADFELLSGDIVEHHANVFFNEAATVGPLTSVLSLRLDRHPLIPVSQTLSPRGAFIYRFAESTSIRVTAGTAFRAPNMVESYMDFALNTSSDGVYIQDFGSQDLVPERIVTAEIGLHDESSVYHMANLVVYYNRVTDFIGLAPVTPSTAPYNPDENGFLAGTTGWINLDPSYTGVGVEAEAELFPMDGLDLFANINIATILEQEGGQTRRDQSTSLFKANLGGSYRSPYRTDVSLAVHYVSNQIWNLRTFDANGSIVITPSPIPARVLLSARIAARPFATEDVEVSIVAFNALGFAKTLRFREHPSGQPVGARLFGSLTYRF